MIEVLSDFLRENKYDHLQDEFKESYFSHPDFPSLFAVTDSLRFLGIKNAAVKVNREYFDELPEIFMTKIYKSNREYFAIVKKIDQEVQVNFDGNKVVISKEEFLLKWEGLVLAIEHNSTIPVKDTVKRKYYFLIMLAVFCPFSSFLYSDITLMALTYKFTALLGAFLGILILLEKYSVSSKKLTNKICGVWSKETSCSSVINSNNRELRGINFSDLAIVFFSVDVISISISSAFIPILGWLSIMALPIILFSIYIQFFELKQSCIICLSVSTIVIIQAVTFIFLGEKQLTLPEFLQFIFIAGVVIVALFEIKKLFIRASHLETENSSLKRFKRNFSIFSFLRKSAKFPEVLRSLRPVIIGKSGAPIKLSLFISPHCNHCHTAYEEAVYLIDSFPEKINLQIYYNLGLENGNPAIVIAQNILQLNETRPEIVRQALDDWHLKKIGMDQWVGKWQQPEIKLSIDEELTRQYEWCRQNNYRFTPVKILNRNKIPDEYSIKEIRYFLNDIEIEESIGFQQGVTAQIN